MTLKITKGKKPIQTVWGIILRDVDGQSWTYLVDDPATADLWLKSYCENELVQRDLEEDALAEIYDSAPSWETDQQGYLDHLLEALDEHVQDAYWFQVLTRHDI